MAHWIILADEPSSDAHAAKIVQHLKTLDPDVTITALGGPELNLVVDSFLGNIVKHHAFGLYERFLKRQHYRRAFSALEETLKSGSFDRAIIVDCAFSQSILSQLFQRYKIPIDTVISPHFWMWDDRKKTQRLAGYSDRLFCFFAQEQDYFKDMHQRCFYFGHPLMDKETLSSRQSLLAEKLVEKTAKDLPVLSLFPGSRPQEIQSLLPLMIEGAKRFQDQHPCQIEVFCDQGHLVPMIEDYLESNPLENLKLWQGELYPLLFMTDMALVSTGSMTLDLALWRIPSLVLGKVSYPSYLFLKYIVRFKLPFFALPNLLMNASIFPEAIQSISSDTIYNHLCHFHDNPQVYQEMPLIDELEKTLKGATNPLKEIAKGLLA